MKSTDGGFKSEHFENMANLKPQSTDLILLNVLFLKTTDKGRPMDKGELALHIYALYPLTIVLYTKNDNDINI